MWLLSPEVSKEKLLESLQLLGRKVSDREFFERWVEGHPLRKWLKRRVEAIRATGIRNIIILEWQKVLDHFLSKHAYLSPRAQRDWPRLLLLIKGFALLNCFNREKAGEATIIANQTDIEAGIALYERVATANELGLSPETYRIYDEVIKPVAETRKSGVSRKEIQHRYFQVYHKPLPDDRLRRQILPVLESAGLVGQDPDPSDRRRMLVVCTVASPISSIGASENNRDKNSAPQALAQKTFNNKVCTDAPHISQPASDPSSENKQNSEFPSDKKECHFETADSPGMCELCGSQGARWWGHGLVSGMKLLVCDPCKADRLDKGRT